MSLVHRDHGQLHPLGKLQEAIGLQSLRGHIYDLVAPLRPVFQRLGDLALRQGAVDIGRRDSRLLQGLHLILHQ